VNDDVDLGVVEERVLVQVRRADREPAVVDDPDLRVHVHDAPAPSTLVERAREEPRHTAAVLVGVHEHADLAARVVAAVVRPCGEEHDDAEVVGGRVAQLVGEHGDDLARPEELALEIHKPLRAAQGPEVALEDRELAAAQRGIDALRHGAHELHVHAAGRLAALHSDVGAGHRVPAQADVLGDVGDDRPLQPDARVVPPDPAAGVVTPPIEPVAGEGREIEPPDVCDAVVDENELLMVAVHRPFLRVERDLDPRPVHEPVAHRAHLAAVGVEERKRRARPRDDAHGDALRRLSEQPGERRAAVAEPQSRREVPAREMDVGARGLHVGSDARERRRPVHEQLDRVAGASRERRRLGPAQGGRVEHALVTDPREAPPVVGAHRSLDAVADRVVDAVEGVQTPSARPSAAARARRGRR
jgi:hypothetical protein